MVLFLPVLYVIGGNIVRITSAALLRQAIAAGAKRYTANMIKKVATRGIVNATAKNIAQFGKSGGPKVRNPRGVGTAKPRGGNTSTTKGSQAKITKPPSSTSKPSNTKGSQAKITKPPSKTSKPSNTKGSNAKITKPPSKTSKTSNRKGSNARFGGKGPLIVGAGLGLVGLGQALNDKKKDKSDIVLESQITPVAKKGDNVSSMIPASGPSKDESFGKAFKRNRNNRQATFTYKDKLYTTRIKEETIADHKKKFKVKGKYK